MGKTFKVVSYTLFRYQTDNLHNSAHCLVKLSLDLFYSIQTASDLSVDRTASHSRTTPTASDPASRSGHDSSVVEGRESVAEGLDHSVAGSVVSDIALEAAEDESLMEALSGNSLQKTSGKTILQQARIGLNIRPPTSLSRSLAIIPFFGGADSSLYRLGKTLQFTNSPEICEKYRNR